ncbi:MAG: tetratricopeptide repeat protein [Acidobacteria bacterium]|nr:tetratricopeptide repeat protein [Acidobacteriota bacterium]
MFFGFLLALLLAAPVAAQEPQPPAPPTLDQAAQLAAAGRDADALAAFRARAAADPNDHAARLWIARLHERMGNPDLAEPVYRSVMLEDPSSVDAMLGVASTLLARAEPEDAIEVLEAVEARAPQNAAAFVLLGRAHRLAGEDLRAIGYFERAMTLAPTDDSRRRLEGARRAYFHRVEIRGFSEQFTGRTPDSRRGEVSLNYRLTDRLRLLGRGEAQRKFRVSDERGGGGVEWRWKPSTTLRGQALVGPDNVVMPEGDYLGEVAYARGPAVWSAGVRYFDFAGARTTVFSPAVVWPASDRLVFDLRYAASWSDASSFRGTQTGHSAGVGGNYRLFRRGWVRAGYAAGVEDFENFSIDRIGHFRANTGVAGLRLDLATLTSVAVDYEHQRRRGGVRMGRVTVSLQQAF